MRFSFAFAVLFVAVAAVSAGVYPVKTGSGKSASKHSKGGGHDKAEDDRFHMQSADGQYVFGHTSGTQGRAETRTKNGTVTGYYSYVDGNGKVVYVNYVADQKGYRVLSNTGVPSASVTIEGGAEPKGPRTENDFLQVFTDFTLRIKDKVIKQAGQETVDLGDGQHQIDIVDPATVYPTKEAKPINNKETDQFLDWNRVKIPSTQNPTVRIDGIEITEGQQQQGAVDPNLDNVTTQKANIKGYDNDGQGSNNNEWDGAVITTETAMKNIPSYPNQPQISTRGNRKGEYADITTVHEEYVQEITTEIGNLRVNTESSVFTNDADNNSPVTKPVESIVVNDGQTTISYSDVSEKSTEGRIINREDFQLTTVAGVKQFEESSTAAVVISESVTKNNQIVKEIEEKIKTPLETDVVLTTGKLLDKELSDNVITENPSERIDLKIADTDFTTITTMVDKKVTVNTRVSTESPAEYEPKATTFQPEIKIGDVETTTGVQYATEENKNDSFDFRTLEPTDVIGTTSSPNRGQSEAQEVQDIAWPEVPAVPAVPQVLVPLNPYPENSGVKNAFVKSPSANSRLVRNFNLNVDDAKSTTTNSSEEIKPTMPTNVSIDEDSSTIFYPKYFIIG